MNPSGSISRTLQRPLRLRIDIPLLVAVVTLLVFGLLMVYSASWDYSRSLGHSPTYIFSRQVRWAIVGIIAAVFFSVIDYHRIRKVIVPLLLGTVLLLFVVLWINDVRLGAARSILGGSVQPSELAKLATILYLAFWLASKKDQLNNISFGLLPMGAILGLTGGLVLLQPDLSAAATVFVMGGILFFLAGGEWRQILFVFVAAVLVGFVVVKLSVTGTTRMTSYLAGLRDPIQASYHVRRALEAIVNGGWFGVGIGRAETKFTGLPVAPTDSIFAVITEETGVIGAGIVILLYLVILWRGLVIARRSQDQLGSLLAAGLSVWIFVEAFINMAVIVGLVPFAGNALPFISAGGSNLTACLAAVGIITSIARQTSERSQQEERSFSAVVNMRGRDGGRSIPRTRRTPGTRDRS